ncbi:MAG: fibronectin type III domain-containing protein [Patescibacteria group bacterium]
MNKNLRLGVVLGSLISLVVLGVIVSNKNLGNTSSQLASLVGPTITNVKVSNISTTKVSIDWKTDVPSTTKIEIKKAWTVSWVIPSGSGTSTNLTTDHTVDIDNLISNTKYSYRVTSCEDTIGCKTWTSSTRFTTLKTTGTDPTDTENPTIPTNLNVSNITQTSATISWTASTDDVAVSGYNIYKKDTSGVVTKSNTSLITGTTYNATGLTPGITRSYQVEAVDTSGKLSGLSNAVVFATTGGVTSDTTSPTSPTGLSSSNITQTSATISWTASTDNIGVTGYDVYVGGILKTSVTSTTASLTGLTAGTTYSVTVKAKDAAGNPPTASTALSLTTLSSIIIPPADMQAPSIPTLTLISKTDVSAAIQWTASTDNVAVAGYHVYNNGVEIGNTSTATSITANGLSPATTYNFTVKAFDTATPANLSTASNILTITTDALHDVTPPTAPSNLTSSNLTPHSVDIAWTASTDNVGVIEYQVYVNGTLVGGTTLATSIHASTLFENTTYTFTISSKDAANNYSLLSTPLTITTPQDNPSAPTNLILISKTHNSAAMQWTVPVVTGGLSPIASYEIYVNGTLIGSTLSATSITANGLSPATTYVFTVKAKNSLGHLSSSSNSLSVTTDTAPDTQAPTAPTGLNAPATEITTNSLNLYWTASTDNVGVVEYQVFKNGVLITGTVTATSVPITSLTPATTYTFTIKAKDAAGNLSPLSTALSVTTKTPADTTSPSTPTGLTTSNITQTSATVSWTASTDNIGVTGYDVYVGGILKTSVTSTTASLTGLTAGTTYSVTVKAKDLAGNVSVASNVLSVVTVSADTTAPTISAISSIPNDTGVTITWTTNEASDSQISYGLTSSYGTTSVLNTSLVTSHSVTVTGLTSGTLYHYKVTSKDASLNSASSADQTFTTTTPAPVCLNAITNPADGRDVWAWHGNTVLITPNSTYQNNFFTYADSHKIQTIYLNANASFVNNNATNIKDFLNKAKTHCMSVEALGGAENWVALPGNPYFTQGATTTAALDFATAVKNLNNSITGNNAKFSAIQYDVEPHTIGSTDGYYPYYGLSDANYTPLQANTAILNALIDMTQAVKAITGSSVKVNLAPPRWYDTSANLNPFSRTGVGVTGKNAMEYLFDNVDILSIQDYVNTASNIHDDAVGELNYAAAHNKKVNIGILLDNSAPASSNFFGSTCANLNSTLQGAYNLMTATEKSGFGVFSIEQYDTGAGYTAGTPSSWTGMCP